MPGEPIMPQSERSPESLAKKHPEYQKWMAAAEAAEGGRDVEDAMSHVESGDADLAYKRARLYSLRKAVGQDVRGFNTEGHHLQQAQSLVDQYKIDLEQAKQMLEDADSETDQIFASKGFEMGRVEVQQMIKELEQEF